MQLKGYALRKYGDKCGEANISYNCPLRHHHRQLPQRLHLPHTTRRGHRPYQFPLHELRIQAGVVRLNSHIQLDIPAGTVQKMRRENIGSIPAY